METFFNVLPYIGACKVLYSVFEFINPYLFTTYATLDAGKKCYWTEMMVTSFVAMLLCCMAAKTIVELGVDDFWASSPFSAETFRFFLGYLWADTVVVLKNWNSWPTGYVTLFHHAVAITGYTLIDASSAGHAFAAIVLLSEITTPCVTQMYFFTAAGMKSSGLYALNGCFIAGFWVLFRILSIGWVLWRLVAMRRELHPFPVDAVIACLSATYALQLFWFRKIVQGAAKHFQKHV